MFFPPAALLQKLPQCDHPLLLRLIAGPDPDQLSFILKENETGEVEVSCGQKKKQVIALRYCASSDKTLNVLPPSLCVAVARLLCPRAAELLDHPGEGGGGAREGSRAKIQQLPAEAATGPGTTRPLTPGAPPLSTCCVVKRVGG